MTDKFNVENYVPVQDRINEFWKKNPSGRIVTHMEHLDHEEFPNRLVVVKAEIFKDNDPASPPVSTGYAKERESKGYVNATSFIENCETSAIGRALATLGYLVDKGRPSKEEMESVARQKSQHQEVLDQIKDLAKKGSAGLKGQVKAKWAVAKEDPIQAAKLLEEVVGSVKE